MDLKNIKEMTDFMKENKIQKLKISKTTTDIELLPDSIIEYHRNKFLKENPEYLKKLKQKKEKEERREKEEREFFFGKKELSTSDIGELHGLQL